MVMRWLFVVILMGWWPSTAQSIEECVTIDTSAWTPMTLSTGTIESVETVKAARDNGVMHIWADHNLEFHGLTIVGDEICLTDPGFNVEASVTESALLEKINLWRSELDQARLDAEALVAAANAELETNIACTIPLAEVDAAINAQDWTNTNVVKNAFRKLVKCLRALEESGRWGVHNP